MDEMMRRRLAVLAKPPEGARTNRQWYDIRAEKGDVTEVFLYDVIDTWWGVSADTFVRDLQAIKTPNITLRVNSPGGDVFDGWAIYQGLKQHPANVTVQIDGLAASSASVVAMAGDRIVMGKPSDMMIHDPWSMMVGPAAVMRQEADLLDKLGGQIAEVYADKTGGSAADFRDLMLAETWLTEQEAVDLGLADEVLGKPSAAKDAYDTSIFAMFFNTPERVLKNKQIVTRDLTERGAERALRDAGFSRSQSRAILHKGWNDPAARDASADATRLLDGLRELTRA